MKKSMKNLPFSVFCYDHYLPFAEARKRSWKIDRSLINRHLVPFFEGRMIHTISAADVMLLQTQKLKEGYQPSSINRMTVLLKYLINCSMRWGLRPRDRDWSEETAELRNIRSRERFLTAEEASRLWTRLEHSSDQILAKLIQLLLLTGARKSELLYARWQDLDWRSQTLTIPLSKSGRTRYIYLSDSALLIFEKLLHCSDSNFIFNRPGEDGPLRNLGRAWLRIREETGLDDLRLHDLRHSYASFLIGQGRSLFEVQKLLGHANAKTTMKYAHLANKQLIEAANLVMCAIQSSQNPAQLPV